MDPIFDPSLPHTLRKQNKWSRKVKNIPSHFKRQPWIVPFLDAAVQLQQLMKPLILQALWLLSPSLSRVGPDLPREYSAVISKCNQLLLDVDVCVAPLHAPLC